jgi:hypothetical protein
MGPVFIYNKRVMKFKRGSLMQKQMLTKEERKLFSKKNINKIRREDFVEYIHMYEAQLDSLRNGYSPEVYQNPIVENIISELEALINDLNTYYYENIIPNADKRKPIMDEVDRDLKDHLEDDLRPITREITKEYKRIKNIRGL